MLMSAAGQMLVGCWPRWLQDVPGGWAAPPHSSLASSQCLRLSRCGGIIHSAWIRRPLLASFVRQNKAPLACNAHGCTKSELAGSLSELR